MIKEYAPHRPFLDYLTLGSHGRTGVYMKTHENDVAEQQLSRGWICEQINGGFWLRAPDISLVDITEPSRIYQMGEDDKKVFSTFQMLRDLRESSDLREYIRGIVVQGKEKYEGFQFYVSEGEVLEGEVRIGGSDSRVNALKHDILTTTVEHPSWKRYKEQADQFLGPTRKVKLSQFDVSQLSEKTATFFTGIQALKAMKYPRSEPIGTTVIENVIQQLPEFDVMILIPTGCFRYLTTFLHEKLLDKLMVWEIHYDPNRQETYKLVNKKIENKRCLIIDKAYTGKTLERAAGMVLEEGGAPIRLGLFPKSRLAVDNLEYVMLLDWVQQSNTLDTKDAHWIDNNYKNILSVTA